MKRMCAMARTSMLGGQLQQAKTLRHVKRLTHCRLPGDVFASGQGPLAAKEIYVKCFAGRRRSFTQRGPRYFHGAVPDLGLVVDAGGNLKTGIPRPTFRV